MAKKGKEIDLGGLRVQVDPFILIRRVIMRQKLLLATIAFLGGIITVAVYITSPKIYYSDSKIAIRTENMEEQYVRKLVNRAMRDLNSKEEMMLIINELDLFSSTRAALPYEMALRRMRRELTVQNSVGSIGVGFESKSPEGAQKVVAFISERVLGTIANLLDSPFRRRIQALDRGLMDVEPKVKDAQEKLFKFKAKHPEIAIRTPDYIRQDSPLAEVETRIKATERDLRRCYAGASAPPRRTKKVGPACRTLKSLKSERDTLLASYTPNHPSVVAKNNEVRKQGKKCEAENEKAGVSAIKPGMSQNECVEAVKARLARIHREKVDIQKKGIKKPMLQQEWAKLSFDSNQLESQLRAIRENRSKTMSDRLIAANEFQENFQLVDPPRVPQIPAKPNRNRMMMIGMAITAILGMMIATIREALRQTYLDAKEFEEQSGLAVMAVLPDISDQ